MILICGVNVSECELFCKLVILLGKLEVLGLFCDYCDFVILLDYYFIEYVIDGFE